MRGRLTGLCLFVIPCVVGMGVATSTHAKEKIPIRFVINDVDGEALPCRIHLFDQDGKPHQPSEYPFWHDHFVCDGRATVNLVPGKYSYHVERGPEYSRAASAIDLADNRSNEVRLVLHRIADLRNEGWYSADLHVHRPVDDIQLLMLAEDLDFAPVLQWWNQPAEDNRRATKLDFKFGDNRIYQILAGEDEREGGALLYFGLPQPLDLRVVSREFPSPMHFVNQARQQNPEVWIDIEKPFWWDVPTWLASSEMNSIGIANNHMCRSQMYENEAWGRPRDIQRLPNPVGNGYWTQEIYYHALNSGIRIPPSAGSASGVLPNPVGYNRVYVHLGNEPLTRQGWFRGLAEGRCFVTNGPLLRVSANDQLPGRILKLTADGTLDVTLDIHLTSSDPISAIEVINNGKVIQRIPCEESTDQEHAISISITGPGWFLVRAIADVPSTFRFASTAPWYVESRAKNPFVSRNSAKFFLNWIDERIARVQQNVEDINQLRAVIQPHENARAFWQERLEKATAE